MSIQYRKKLAPQIYVGTEFLPRKPSGNIYITTTAIPELTQLEIRTEYPNMEYLHIGAGVTITELKEFLEELAKEGRITHFLVFVLTGPTAGCPWRNELHS